MAPGNYVGATGINTMVTSATAVVIHGGGASLLPASGSDLPTIQAYDVAAIVHDLDFPGNNAFASSIQCDTLCTVYRVSIENAGGIIAGPNTTVDDTTIMNPIGGPAILVRNGTHLSLDRVTIRGGSVGIGEGGTGAIVDLHNLLISGTSGGGMNLPTTTGRIEFATIADTGLSGTTPRAVNCTSGLTMSSSIIWTPSGTPVGGSCTLTSVIAGPTAVAGTQNANPMFRDEPHGDYHITATSPAKDTVDTGPPTDFEGDPRPQGVRFDIGADEAPP